MIWINPMENHDLPLSIGISVGLLVGAQDNEAIDVVAVAAVYQMVRV
jgi:hypothetical protein